MVMEGAQGEPWSLICGGRTIANLVQRWHKNHARVGLLSHQSHTGLACGRIVSFHAHYLKNESPPLAYVWEPWGANETSLVGGNTALSSAVHSLHCPHCQTHDLPLTSHVQSVG